VFLKQAVLADAAALRGQRSGRVATERRNQEQPAALSERPTEPDWASVQTQESS